MSLSPDFLDAALAGDAHEASRVLGARVPDDWPDLRDTQQLFLERLRADPALAPWSLRAIVVCAESRMVGQIGFHGAPGPEGLELTYTVFARDRRRGYAREACSALMDRAHVVHGVERFTVTISSDNEPSLALAGALGFRRFGPQVFERRVARA